MQPKKPPDLMDFVLIIDFGLVFFQLSIAYSTYINYAAPFLF